MSQREVFLVGHLDYFFGPFVAALAAKGHTSVRYRAPVKSLANKDALANATALYARRFVPVSREALGRAPRLTAVASTRRGTEGLARPNSASWSATARTGERRKHGEATVLTPLSGQYDVNAAQQIPRSHLGQPHLTARRRSMFATREVLAVRRGNRIGN